jgi:mRNA-degrading endonuclease HigB of HigAB toxin-antitoxin module
MTSLNVLLQDMSHKALRLFWERHPDAEQPLRAWYANARQAQWRTPADIKQIMARPASLQTVV